MRSAHFCQRTSSRLAVILAFVSCRAASCRLFLFDFGYPFLTIRNSKILKCAYLYVGLGEIIQPTLLCANVLHSVCGCSNWSHSVQSVSIFVRLKLVGDGECSISFGAESLSNDAYVFPPSRYCDKRERCYVYQLFLVSSFDTFMHLLRLSRHLGRRNT